MNRRKFIATMGGAAGSFAGGPWLRPAAAAEPQDAELAVLNAKVYTVDSGIPKAEAFAVKGGRLTAVGTTAEIRALIGKNTQTYDARGMTIVPGFIDCHNTRPETRCFMR